MRNFIKHKLTSIYKYEFWPFWLFYIPAYFYGAFLALKARSLTYYTAANPGMRYSGAFGYSKFHVIEQIDHKYKPRTILVNYQGEVSDIRSRVEAEFDYPVILKPDIGERGKMVEKINMAYELKNYFEKAESGDYIVQEFVDLPIELGIFYHKSSNHNAAISSILVKKFLLIEGDGESTLEELIDSNVRAYKRRDYLRKKYCSRLSEVIGKNVQLPMEPIGNHNRGTEFLNGEHINDPQLTKVFEDVASSIDGFYYGRFDLKVSDIDDLKNGININVFEVNGVNSEPAHIYDQNINILNAYRSVFYHMDIMYEISKENQKRGHKLASPIQYYRDMYRYLVLNKI
ncbi:MAG: hypothetical protein HKN92_08835 [Chitinophagales bacterium]|nr:hypothetical protein [Chitinophagales bacterium]